MAQLGWIIQTLEILCTVWLQKLDITITGYEMDRTANGMCKCQYQHIHVEYEYSCTNDDEQYQELIKELTATGIVKILKEFPVDDGNKEDLIQYSISCMWQKTSLQACYNYKICY